MSLQNRPIKKSNGPKACIGGIVINKVIRRVALCIALIFVVMLSFSVMALAAPADEAATAAVVAAEEAASESLLSVKALSAAIVVGVVATGGAIAMAIAIKKSLDSIARQPEAGSMVRGSLMLGLLFIETAIIYALVIAIIIIFVL